MAGSRGCGTAELWTQREDVGPASASSHIAYDSDRGVAVLLCGLNTGFPSQTWEWDGSEWTQVADFGSSFRSGAALTYDSGSRQTVLFGGIKGCLRGLAQRHVDVGRHAVGVGFRHGTPGPRVSGAHL
jgi:hypothetical protein